MKISGFRKSGRYCLFRKFFVYAVTLLQTKSGTDYILVARRFNAVVMLATSYQAAKPRNIFFVRTVIRMILMNTMIIFPNKRKS
jgi:hypothetical protein